MNVTQDLDIWTLVVNASVVVKVVLVLLIAVSFLSWMFIFQKWFAIRRARRQTEQFEREFWSGNELTALYQGAVNNRHTIGSLERIFEAGFREFAKLRGQKGTDASDMVDSARRDFVQKCKLPELEFFADSFTTQADLARPAQPSVVSPR